MLIERRDYDSQDQLEKNFADLPEKTKKLVESQFKRKKSMDIKVAVAPPGWGGTVEEMKKHKDITNPWALAWWMSKKDKGDKWGPGGKLTKKPEPHYKEKKKKSCQDRISEIVDRVIGIEIPVVIDPVIGSSKKYSTNDTIKTQSGDNINIRTNYEEKNGDILLEEYVVEKNGKIETYNNIENFTTRLVAEGLL